MSDHVRIFDTTLRDGEQSPGCSMTTPQKLLLAQQLAELGVDVIEAGFAAASPDDFNAVQSIARTVKGKGIDYMETEPGWHLGYLGAEDEAKARETILNTVISQ